MATKRHLEDHGDPTASKRMRSLPSLRMVIMEAVVAKSTQNFCLVLETLFRKVVKEEVEHGLARRAPLLQRSPPMHIEGSSSSMLQLLFKKPPSLPIFTENNIQDEDGNPLEILLVDIRSGKRPQALSHTPIKVELVVLDGDFPCEESADWSSSDFSRHILKERRGRRPLLAGDTAVTLKDGAASIDELKFTDNSSWTRSRNFRIGAQVSPESLQGSSIRQAVTERFMVKDHRGESYKKHYPPALADEVWRLEKIGRDGVFHRRLASHNINTVQEFLQLSVVDTSHLRKILKMSDRNWEATIQHARTCPLGEKLYALRGPRYAVVLSPICEVVRIESDGYSCTLQELSKPLRASVQELVMEAYRCWDRLEEIDLPLPGEPMHEQVNELPYRVEGFPEGGFIQDEAEKEFINWSPAMQYM